MAKSGLAQSTSSRRREDIEIRVPVVGFVRLNPYEQEVLGSPYVQRLRRIRQLALTDLVYPGAMHTRFEHALGVMHWATLAFDTLRRKAELLLQKHFHCSDRDLARVKQVLRIAAMLHDVGHPPLSHAGESLLPEKDAGQRYRHEDYSIAIIEGPLREPIERSRRPNGMRIRAEEVADFLRKGPPTAGRRAETLFWRQLIASQLDVDRMDYLLRDAHHLGVRYGQFDVDRLLACLTVAEKDEEPRIAVEGGGLHAAEGLILARYFMFTQVYFHKTRRAYDHHLEKATKAILANKKGLLPPPSPTGLREFLDLDDHWLLRGIMRDTRCDDCRRIQERAHLVVAYETPDHPNEREMDDFANAKDALGDLAQWVDTAEDAPFKFQRTDVWIADGPGGREPRLLETGSPLIRDLPEIIYKKRIYVDPRNRMRAQRIISSVRRHTT